jgi:4-amino-4-deoxy-L-arabinose transferase-like glycosyltransferase
MPGKEWWQKWEERFDWRFLFGLVILAFLVRLPLLLFPEVIHNDGTEYIRHAREILLGNWSASKAPPLYPFLIAFFQFFTGNFERAGIWVSAVLGTLIILPVFYLGKAIFNDKIAILSALIAAVHPILASASGSVLTESTYYFLLVASVLFGWKVFQKGRLFDLLLFSLLISLAYLTRPEAIGLVFVFGIWVLLVSPAEERRPWARRVGLGFLVLLCFLLFTSPYLIQMRKETGRWAISKKFSVSVDSSSKGEGGASVESILRKREINFYSLVQDPLAVSKKVFIGFLNSLYKFQQAFSPPLFLLAVLAFILGRQSLSWRGSLYLLANVVFFLGLVFPFFWVTRRYASQMVPIALPWAAAGFLALSGWLSKRFQEGTFQRKVPALLLVLLLLSLFVQGRLFHGRDHRLIQREAGLLMKERLQRGARVMGREPQEAFYAELPWTRMPAEPYERIMEAARSKGARYLVVGDEIEKDSPGFLEKSKTGELIPVLDLKKKDQAVLVFEIKDPQNR